MSQERKYLCSDNVDDVLSYGRGKEATPTLCEALDLVRLHLHLHDGDLQEPGLS
jgi:hypothetical protein